MNQMLARRVRRMSGRTVKRLLVFACAAVSMLTPAHPVFAGSGCQFVLGFQSMHDQIPAAVGDCVDDQTFAANGDAIQHTTKGMLVWRKNDNWTAYTNGARTWLNGPYGMQSRRNTDRFQWEIVGHGPAVVPMLPAESTNYLVFWEPEDWPNDGCRVEGTIPTTHTLICLSDKVVPITPLIPAEWNPIDLAGTGVKLTGTYPVAANGRPAQRYVGELPTPQGAYYWTEILWREGDVVVDVTAQSPLMATAASTPDTAAVDAYVQAVVNGGLLSFSCDNLDPSSYRCLN